MAYMPGELTATGTMVAGSGLHVRDDTPSHPSLLIIAYHLSLLRKIVSDGVLWCP